MKKRRLLKALSLILALILSFSIIPIVVFATSETTVNGENIYNEYLSLNVKKSNGHFSIGTTGGNPDLTTDDNKKLLFGWPDSWSSYTTIVVDDNIYKYGDNGFVESPSFSAKDGAVLVAKYGDIEVCQQINIVENNSTNRKDVVQISYVVTNKGTKSHDFGTRIMLDTMLGSNDEAPFRVPGHGSITTQTEFEGSDIPQYWQAFDSLDNPKVVSQGSFLRTTVNKPDKVQFTNWSKVYNNPWNCPVAAGESNGDSAVTITWNKKVLKAGKTRTYTTHYGLSELVQDNRPPLLVSIYGDSTLSLENGQYSPNPFDVTVYIKNIGSGIAKNPWIEISFPGDNLTTNGMKRVRISLNDIGRNEELQQSWKVTAKNVSQDTHEVINITVGADNTETKTVSKYITIPALGKNNEIKWGKKTWLGSWSGENNLSFLNRKEDFFKTDIWGNYKNMYYELDDNYFYSLVAGMEPTVIEYIGNQRNEDWGGSCYGMSVVVSLMKDGQLTPNYWQKRAKVAHDLKAPKNSATVRNLINYYHLSQFLPDAVDLDFTYIKMPEREILKQIVTDCQKVQNGGLPVIINYWWLANEIDEENGKHKTYGHAVIGYHVDRANHDETGENSYRISICDPNKSSWMYLYISSDYSKWSYDGMKKTSDDPKGVWVKDGVEQKQMSGPYAALDWIDIRNPETGVDRSRLKNYNSNFINNYTATGYAILDSTGKKIEGEKTINKSGQEITYLPDGNQFTIVPDDGSNEIDASLVLKDCSTTVKATNADKVTVNKNGSVAFKGDSSDCDISLTLNSSLSTLPWYTVNLKGSDINDYEMKPTSEGVLVSGSNLKNTQITANNLEQTVYVDVSTDATSVLLRDEGNGKVGVYTDEDGDGKYETKIAEGGEDKPVTEEQSLFLKIFKVIGNILLIPFKLILALIRAIINLFK